MFKGRFVNAFPNDFYFLYVSSFHLYSPPRFLDDDDDLHQGGGCQDAP